MSGNGPSNNQQKTEMDCKHQPKANGLYHTSSPDLEPTGKRKRNIRRRDLEVETKRMSYTWGQLWTLAQDRNAWGALVGANGNDGYDDVVTS